MAFVQNGTGSVEALGMSNSFDMAVPAMNLREPGTLLGYIRWRLDQMFKNKIRFHYWIIEEDFILGMLLNKFTGDISRTEFPPKKVFDKFLANIDNKLEKPFFAWLHLYPPHDPYLPPQPYKGFFDNSSKFRTKKSIHKLKVSLQGGANVRHSDIATFRARYDEFIRYIDDTFKYFIDELDRREMENTVIILSADHGESFQHGYFIHGGPFLYEEVTHIPLIIKEVGQKRGQIINKIVEQIDIPATILDLANIQPPMWMEGQSLVPLLRGKNLPPRPAFSMNFEENPSRGNPIVKGTIAIWEGNFKLIHYLGKKKTLLFDLKKDPDELINLFDKESVIAQHLLAQIQDNLEMANERISRGNL
jgi:arylsulfatase A-like enzyme